MPACLDLYKALVFIRGQSLTVIYNLELEFQVAELFNLLKTRVGELNMFINTQPSAVDEEYLCKQRFILQVML